MLERLKEEVLKANKLISNEKLAILTWGNVSGFDSETRLIVIKASGVEYSSMGLEHMVVVNLKGEVVEGDYIPSTDLATHIELYKGFGDIGGIVHTHSSFATIWAQSGRDIPCYGTTHADYFKGSVPCSRKMTPSEIERDYEANTGKAILDTFAARDHHCTRAVLVRCHGPFVWGDSALDAMHNACVLENVARMAYFTERLMNGGGPLVDDALLKKHYDRKFGENAYYGQAVRKEAL